MDFLSFDPRLTQWAQSGNVQELTAYIQNTPNLWETFHAYNDCSQLFPPLQTAVEAGQLECVKAFEPLVATKSWNEIFERAFEYKHYDMAQWLISKLTPQLIEDWSCAFASKGNLCAIETTLPYLSDQGKQMVLYYAASTQHDNVVDYLSEHTNAAEILRWMLAQENITTAEHEQWINHKLNQLQNTRLTQTIQSVATPRVSRKI